MLGRIRQHALWMIVPLMLIAVLVTSCLLGRRSAKPAVTIVSPVNGAQLTVGESVSIQSLSLDDEGIVRVELWIDGELLRVDAAQPAEGVPAFEVAQVWVPSVEGRHNITVKALSSRGLVSDPSTILVEVVPAGTVVQAEPSPTPTEAVLPTATVAAPAATPSCQNNATFVTDVTVPDETTFKPGTTFEKVWRMRNTGTCAWGPGYAWIYESGDRMEAQPSASVPPTIPGAEADIRVTMTAPPEPGRYIGRWRLQGPDGQPFGQRAIVVIVVVPSGLTAPAAPSDLVAKVEESGAVRLTWVDHATNEDGVRIYSDDGSTVIASVDEADVTEIVVESVPCDSDIGFIVKAYNQAGESPASPVARIHTSACQPNLPVVRYFVADPETIAPGESSQLSWDLEGAREARLFPGGENGVVAPGSMTVSPRETTTYRLVATNEHGTVEKKVTVHVQVQATSGPQVAILSSTDVAGEDETFQVIVSGRDDRGMEAIWWWATDTSEGELDDVYAFQCDGELDCQQIWEINAQAAGSITLAANGRSTSGRQVEQDGEAPVTVVRVVPILVHKDELSLRRTRCIDLDAGIPGACNDPSMDLRWDVEDEGLEWLTGIHGARLAVLEDIHALRDVRYQDVVEADFADRLALRDESGDRLEEGSVLAVETDEGRPSKLLIMSLGERSIELEVVTYLE